MCGIAGWALAPGVERPLAQLRDMAARLAHRGPDHRGELVLAERGIALAHARLSIIDLSARGHQPMTTASGDTALIFGGELYNFVELRRQLEREGRSFASQSDSEVVLQAIAAWGEDALQRFCGMFAFAAWREADRQLLLARDPLGMKPLYYAALPRGEGIAFASEVKAFAALPDLELRVEPSSLRQFLELGYTYTDQDTIFRGIRKLPPGCFLRLQDGRAEGPFAFYRPPAPTRTGASFDACVDELHVALREVVGEHLVADVPVAVLLSGGLDSSLVAALAAQRGPLTTLAMRFADSAIDETPHARMVAEALGTDHREIVISPQATADTIAEDCRFFDDLFGDWGLISTRWLYRACREQGIKVALVGEGADELFAGYPVFTAVAERRRPSLRAWELMRLYRRYSGQRYGRQFDLFRGVFGSLLAETDGDLFQAVRLFEVRHQLPNNYVMKVDKASMSASVEARAPFLDRRIADIALSLPQEALLWQGRNKRILREIARRYQLLPAAIVEREKFGAPLAVTWMDESPAFRGYARETVLRSGGWAETLGLRRAMKAYFDDQRAGFPFPSPLSIFRNLAWRLLLLELWSRHYLRDGVRQAA